MVFEAHGNGWKQFFGGMNNVPLRHDGEPLDLQLCHAIGFEQSMQCMLGDDAKAKACGHSLLDGLVAA
mgnify:FL=1